MANNPMTTASDWYNYGHGVTMGEQIDNNRDASLRSRLRGYQSRTTRRVERRVVAIQNPARQVAPTVLKQDQLPIKPLVKKKDPISASRFYLPKQRRSKVLRRRGLSRTKQDAIEIQQKNSSRLKVILVLLVICALLVGLIILLISWQSHQLVKPQTALKSVDRLYISGV